MKQHLSMAIVLLILGSIVATAQPRGERGRAMMEKLNLTEEQQQKFQALHMAQQKAMIDERAAEQKARLGLKELFDAETPDQHAIQKKVREIADLRVKAETGRINHWFEVNKILAPEQQKIWKKVPRMMANGRGMRADMRGERMGRMPMMHEGRGMERMERMERMHR